MEGGENMDEKIIKGPLPFVGFPETKEGETPEGWTKVETKEE